MRHPFASLIVKPSPPPFPPLTPVTVCKHNHLLEVQRIVFLRQNPGDAKCQKPLNSASPDFVPSPQLSEKDDLTSPSLKQRHTRKTCATRWQARQ